MTTSGLTFPRSEALNAILSQKNHFLCLDTYLQQIKAGLSMKLPLPMFSMAGNGATILSINQGLFFPTDLSKAASADKSLRLTLSTISPADEPFDPTVQTDVDLTKAMPISASISAKITLVTKLIHPETKEEFTLSSPRQYLQMLMPKPSKPVSSFLHLCWNRSLWIVASIPSRPLSPHWLG